MSAQAASTRDPSRGRDSSAATRRVSCRKEVRRVTV
jgi:hypothetical protein